MNEQDRISREEMIALIINSKYSINDQIALLRQKDSKPDEWEEFYNFAEDVKRKVTKEYEQSGWLDMSLEIKGSVDMEIDRAVIPELPPSKMEQLRADIDFLAIMGGFNL